VEQSQRNSLFDKCRCGRNKHANRDKCYKCHAKWRYHNDPKYKESKNSRSRKDAVTPCSCHPSCATHVPRLH